MIKLTDALRDVVSGSALLQAGLAHRLFNLTQLAAYVRPLVAVRTKKDVSNSAIKMSLSRIARDMAGRMPAAEDFRLDSLSVTSGLAVVTYASDPAVRRVVRQVYDALSRRGLYVTVTESTSEITIILDRRELVRLDRAVSARAKHRDAQTAAVVGRFSASYTTAPGLIYHLVQQLELQGLNIVEISSTFTEMIFYVDEADVPLAFETLHTRFMQ